MKKLALMSAVAALGLAASTQAAVVTDTLQLAGVYNPTTGAVVSTNSADFDALIKSHTPYVYRFNILTQWNGLGASESFGNMAYTVATLPAGVSRVPANLASIKANYQPTNPSIGFDGSSTSLNTFSPNADKGTSSTDLLGIVVSVDNSNIGQVFDSNGDPTADPRLNLARGVQLKVGAFDVIFDGSTNGATVSLTNQQFAVLDDNTKLFGATNNIQDGAPASSQFIVPEPASLSLLGLGGLALAARRRRA